MGTLDTAQTACSRVYELLIIMVNIEKHMQRHLQLSEHLYVPGNCNIIPGINAARIRCSFLIVSHGGML